MRTRNLLLIAFVLISAVTFGQETRFGIKAGVHGSNFSSDIPDFESDMKIGFHIGAGVDLGLSDNFSINADLLYTMKGAQQKTTTEISIAGSTVKRTSEDDVTVSYLEIPIVAKYTLESGLYFNVGPYLGIRMGYKTESEVTTTTTPSGGSPTTTTSSVSSTEDEGITSSDFGLKAGLGFKMESGLDIGLNYGLGFGNLLDSDAGGDDYYIHNSTIGLTIGYWFGGN